MTIFSPFLYEEKMQRTEDEALIRGFGIASEISFAFGAPNVPGRRKGTVIICMDGNRAWEVF